MKNKMKNKKGFTLMEMLIVVAIMVVLVAVAIPTFTNSLDSAKKTTDDANLRAAKSVAATTVMLQSAGEVDDDDKITSGMMFDISEGKFITKPAAANIDKSDKGQSSDNSSKVIIVTITDGVPSVAWTPIS